MTSPVIVIDKVSKRYRLYRERQQSLKGALLRRGRARFDEFWALRDVSIEIVPGQTFGLIGENGSGKSTLLKCIARILRPDAGSIKTTGKVAALLELGSGFHPELSGRENVYLNGSILGLSKKEIGSKFDAIVDFAGVDQFIDQPVKNYSSGMYVRLGFSIAINVDPDILLVDEILAVGDAAFQEKCMEKFLDFRRQGKTVVVVSHSMGTMRTFCNEAARLDHGKLVAIGRADHVVDDYIDEGHAERDVTMQGGTRWGSGEVQLTDVAMLDGEGKPTTRVRTGDPLTIRLRFNARERIERPVFGLAIETTDGVWAWGHNTRDAEYVPEAIEGPGTLDYHIPALLLQQGTFDLHAGITDYSMAHTYDFLRACYRFDVDHGTPRESGGIFCMNGSWQDLAVIAPVADAAGGD